MLRAPSYGGIAALLKSDIFSLVFILGGMFFFTSDVWSSFFPFPWQQTSLAMYSAAEMLIILQTVLTQVTFYLVTLVCRVATYEAKMNASM